MVRDAVPLGDCGRALVIKLRHHGDVLLASPVVSVLKAHAPHMEVDALVYDDTAPMLEGHPGLAQVHTVGRAWRSLALLKQMNHETALLARLRARRYDLVVHLTEHPRGAWLRRLLGARYGVAPAMPERGAWWRRSFTHLYPLVRNRHVVEANLDALRRIGIQPAPDGRALTFVPGAEASARVERLLPQARYVHVHPASRWRFKCWPAERNAELIDRLAADGLQVVVTAAPDEISFIEEILGRARSRPVNLAGRLSLKELGAVAARAQLFVGVDSMPMHLAAAMGVPCVALFGPTGEALWRPWGVAHRVVTTTHTCRPCGVDGCGGGKVSECLAFLPVQAVYDAARELLSGRAA